MTNSASDEKAFEIARHQAYWPHVLFANRNPTDNDPNMSAQWWYNYQDKIMWIWDKKWRLF